MMSVEQQHEHGQHYAAQLYSGNNVVSVLALESGTAAVSPLQNNRLVCFTAYTAAETETRELQGNPPQALHKL